MDPKKKAREHLVAAEKHIKDSEFDLARDEVLKAQELDPSNVYTFAFLERIDFFKQQSSKEEPLFPGTPLPEDAVDNDKFEKSPETDEIETPDESAVPDTNEKYEGDDKSDREQSEDPIYLAILNSIQDFENQLSVISDRAKERRHYTDLSPVIDKADSIKNRIATAREGLDEYQDTELHNVNEKIILEVENELNILDEYIKSFREPSDQLSMISSLKEELSDFRETIRHARETYSEEEVREKLSDFERRLDELTQSMESNHLIENKFKHIQSLLDTVESKARGLSLPDSHEEAGSQKDQYYQELARRVDDLQQSIPSYDEIKKSTDGLRAELSQLESRLQKLNDEVRSLPQSTSEFEEIREQIKSLSTQVEVTRQPITGLEHQMQQLQQDIQRSAVPHESVDNPDALRSEIDALKNELERINLEVRNAQKASSGFDELRGQINALTSYLDTIGEPLLDLENRVQQLSQGIPAKELSPGEPADLSEFKSEMSGLKSELEKVSEDVRNAMQSSTDLNELRQQIRDISSRLEVSDEPLSGLEQRVRQLSEDIGKKPDLPDGIDDLSEFRAEMLAVKSELGKISDEVRDAKEGMTEFDELRQQIRDLSSRLEVYGEPLSRLEQRVQQLSKDIGNRPDLPDGIGDLNKFRSEMLTLKNEVGKISGEVRDAKEGITILDELRQQIHDLSSRLEASGKPLSDLEQQVHQLSRTIPGISRKNENIEELEKVIGDLQERTNQLQSLPVRIEDIIDAQQHLSGNYADLEQRLQDFIIAGTNKIVGQEHLDHLKNDIVSLRKQLDDIATETADIKVFKQAHSEMISLYKDLEERFVTFIKNQTGQRDIYRNELKEQSAALENQLSAIQSESKRKQGDIENKLTRLTENSNALKLKLDYEIESLKASGYDRESYHKIEDRIKVLEDKREREQRDYQSTLAKITDQLNTLIQQVETDKHERRDSEKRKLEVGLKYFKSAADDAWEHGEPDAHRAAELQNLAELFSIPESIEKEILREVKLKKYSQAVKKAIADKKASQKDGPSLEQLRQLYAVSLEEYMEYESVFLDELVSTQYHGTIMVISDDTSTRDDLSERLKSTGFTVVHISKPESFPEKIGSVNPQVIICETVFRATKFKGVELLRDIRKVEKYNHLPFILLADPYEIAGIKKELRDIHDAVLVKPVEFYDLLDTIDDKLKKIRDRLSSQHLE